MQLSPDLKAQGLATTIQGFFLTIEDAPSPHQSEQEPNTDEHLIASPEQAITSLVQEINKNHKLSRQEIIQILEDQVISQMLVFLSESERTGAIRPRLLRRVLPGSPQSEKI